MIVVNPADVLAKVREAAELGELDALIEKQAQFGRRVTQKNKWQVKWRTCLVKARSSSYNVQQVIA